MKKTMLNLLFCVSALATVGSAGALEVIVNNPPPAEVREVIPPSPGPGHVWVNGHWGWVDNRWVWTSGSWTLPPHPDSYWVPGHWNHIDRGYHWSEGYWR